ncbi:MFS transporter [Mangrovibacterium marinum]|uniref:GPH family glycoside/pentoside/hexuronide:cation symporter n=1 Tax=Mangrovibacterium marinum TaxID=1639118 RepID=A0A2T5C1Y9_9BACT|nr:MFS transporter [Mangrovibacterium marinum]PTN08685.1 GPH family glycoside/pentoside/hexuronide:cation symporter [Mangrovibacterium marinum]
MKSQKLSILEKIGYGSGDAAVNVVISSMFLIITYFYTDIFGIKPTDVALMFGLVRLIDAISDPLMGIITDKYKSEKWGSFRPYFLYLSVPFGISVFLTFTTPDFDYAGKLIWAYATYILVTLMFTSVTIPYISLIGVLTNDPQERLEASGYRLFFAKVAAFGVSILVPIMAKSLGAGNLARGYQLAMGVMALMGTLLFLFCFVTTKERVEHIVEKTPYLKQLKYLVKNGQWMLLVGSCLSGTTGYVIRASVAIYYAKYYLGGDEIVQSTFMGTGVAAAILAMPLSTLITKRFCKVKLFWISQFGVGILSAFMFFLIKPQPDSMMLAYVLYFILSLVVDVHAPVFWTAIAEAVDYGQAQTGVRVSGLAFGGISFAQKAGMGIAGGVVGLLLSAFNYTAPTEGIPNPVQSDTALLGIALMLTLIPAVFHVINGLLIKQYKITDEYYETVIKAQIHI